MTLRKYDPTLKTEIHNVLDAAADFQKQQAERARKREETARRMDAAILMNDPLPPSAA